ncbi:MAG: phosphate ABC transporter permease PstA [Micrococcales bacterium]
MTDVTVSMDPGNLGPLPRPASEPWNAKNPTRSAKILLASTLPALVSLAIAFLAKLDPAVAMILVFLPLQIIASVWVGVNLYGKKGFADALLVVFTIFFSAFVGILLTSVVWSVVSQGLHAMSLQFVTQNNIYITPTTSLDYGGVGHAMLGTILIVGFTTLLTVPLGLLVAVYLTETTSKLRTVVRTLVQAMSGLPSVVAGLFIYSALIVQFHISYGGWLGSLALLPLMLPTVSRVAEEALRLVPQELRNGALALGAPAYRAFLQVTLPAARTGLVTAVILGIARVIGETAPLILTVNNANGTVLDLGKPMASLPTYIFQFIANSNDTSTSRAWGAALMVLILVTILFTAARLVGRDKRTAKRK